MTNIFIANASPLLSGDVFSKYYNEMPDERRAKIDRCRHDKDKRLSLCAGILLKKALWEAGREELIDKIVASEKGRPVFEGVDDFDFNLSHSGEMAICAISDHAIGCDIQLIEANNGKIAERCFTEGEKAYVFEVDDPAEITNRFYRIWVMKEAYTKLSGEGITRDFRSFDVLKTEDCFYVERLEDYYISVAGVKTEEKIKNIEIFL